MDSRLQEMLDHHEITKLLYEYCHGCDRADEVRMASVYAADSWDDHGANKCPGPEFAARTMKTMTSTNMCGHLLGQTLINVRGEEAGAETSFIATVRAPSNEGGEHLHQIGGRYVDTLVREEGRWKIKTRLCVKDWSISQPIVSDWLAGRPYVQGERSNMDPSFAALGIQHSGKPGQKTQ